jgi:hypothetical protein
MTSDNKKIDKKEITDYFRSNIFEAYSHYNVWKMIAYSKSKGVVSEEMANKYVEIQKYHNSYFSIAERASLLSFVILVLHPFDGDNRANSLYKVDDKGTKKFIKDNKETIGELFLVRNKVLAHRDIEVNSVNKDKYKIPSVDRLDIFFENLITFYNQICREVDNSSTIFDDALDLKNDVEGLFMSLYRGEKMRVTEIDVDYFWNENNKKISDII